jgi:hypothetical protein
MRYRRTWCNAADAAGMTSGADARATDAHSIAAAATARADATATTSSGTAAAAAAASTRTSAATSATAAAAPTTAASATAASATTGECVTDRSQGKECCKQNGGQSHVFAPGGQEGGPAERNNAGRSVSYRWAGAVYPKSQ